MSHLLKRISLCAVFSCIILFFQANLKVHAQSCPSFNCTYPSSTIPTIDGNPSEWPCVLNNPAYEKKAFAHDAFQVLHVDNQWTGGSSDADVDPQTNWHWVNGNANDKGDIANAGAVLIGCTLYFFGDRASISGDAQIGFWLFRGGVAPIGTGATSSGFTGHHLAGDLLIISNFTNGGGNAAPTVYVWTIDAAHPDGYPKLVTSNVNGIIRTNSATIAAPNGLINSGLINNQCWKFFPKSGANQTYPAPLFFEGSVDVCLAEGTTTPPCFNRFLLETRNSQSISASLQDFVAGEFSGTANINGDVTIKTGITSIAPATGCSENFGMNLIKTLTADLTATGGTTYTWTRTPVDAATSFSFNSATGAATFTVLPLDPLNPPAGTYQFIVTSSAANGCSGTDTVCINPTYSCVSCGITTSDICLGSDLTFSLNDPLNSDFNYTWTKPDGTTVQNVTSITSTPSTAGTKTASVAISSKNGFITCSGCNASAEVNAQPSISTQYNAPGCADKAFTVTVLGATAGYAYTITQSGNNSSQTITPNTNGDFTFSNLVQGDGYTVTVDNKGCTASESCKDKAAPVALASVLKTPDTYNIMLGTPTKVTAVPNPFKDKVRFNLTSAISGMGKLELFNMIGQKVVTVFEGYVQAGRPLIKEYNAASIQRNMLIYVFTVGDQQVSGKLIGLK
jgi:hypothetical protein